MRFSLDEVCWVIEKECRREAMLRVCEFKREKAGRADSLAENECGEVEALLCGRDRVLE